MSIALASQLLQQRRNVNVVRRPTLDVRYGTVFAALPQEILTEAG